MSGVDISILLCNRFVRDACLHFVNCLVAVVPGVQLFVSGVIMDAAVAGVALWEEHHWTLVAARK